MAKREKQYIEKILPEFLIQRSLGFKTIVLVFGAAILLISSSMRPDYPFLWKPVFIIGALIEWLIVATVYVEIARIERDIRRSQRAIRETKDSVFSSISQSEGGIQSIEDRLTVLEKKIDDRSGRGLESRIVSLEDQVDPLEKKVDGGGRGSLEQRISDLENWVSKFDRSMR